MNIFEGARRITKLTAALIIFGYIFWGATDSPYIFTTYNITFSNPPIQTSDGCPFDSQSKRIARTTANNTYVDVTLCFLAKDFPLSQRLIPYKFEKGLYWGNEKYTPDVNQYVDNTSLAFVIPKAYEEKLDKQWWSKRFNGLGAIFGWMLLNLTMLFLFAWAVGWIVRGFIGIPQRQDKKSDA